MREVKFRAWDGQDKLIRNVQQLLFNKQNEVDIKIYEEWFATGPDLILMQYTGLKDKNGAEIYEGDICQVDDGLSDYWYVVEWVFAGWQAVTYKKKNSSVRGISNGVNSFYIEPDCTSEMTIIGNVYENKELLACD